MLHINLLLSDMLINLNSYKGLKFIHFKAYIFLILALFYTTLSSAQQKKASISKVKSINKPRFKAEDMGLPPNMIQVRISITALNKDVNTCISQQPFAIKAKVNQIVNLGNAIHNGIYPGTNIQIIVQDTSIFEQLKNLPKENLLISITAHLCKDATNTWYSLTKILA